MTFPTSRTIAAVVLWLSLAVNVMGTGVGVVRRDLARAGLSSVLAVTVALALWLTSRD